MAAQLPLFSSAPKEQLPGANGNGASHGHANGSGRSSPSSSFGVTNLPSLFARPRAGFLASGIAKRLAAALLIGLACVVGLSTVLPVRPFLPALFLRPH